MALGFGLIMGRLGIVDMTITLLVCIEQEETRRIVRCYRVGGVCELGVNSGMFPVLCSYVAVSLLYHSTR